MTETTPTAAEIRATREAEARAARQAAERELAGRFQAELTALGCCAIVKQNEYGAVRLECGLQGEDRKHDLTVGFDAESRRDSFGWHRGYTGRWRVVYTRGDGNYTRVNRVVAKDIAKTARAILDDLQGDRAHRARQAEQKAAEAARAATIEGIAAAAGGVALGRGSRFELAPGNPGEFRLTIGRLTPEQAERLLAAAVDILG